MFSFQPINGRPNKNARCSFGWSPKFLSAKTRSSASYLSESTKTYHSRFPTQSSSSSKSSGEPQVLKFLISPFSKPTNWRLSIFYLTWLSTIIPRTLVCQSAMSHQSWPSARCTGRRGTCCSCCPRTIRQLLVHSAGSNIRCCATSWRCA